FKSAPAPAFESMEVVLTPDYSMWDGRYANNAWLQELPDPVSKLTWDNAALMSPATAKKLGIAVVEEDIRYKRGTGSWGDFIEISVGDKKLSVAVIVSPGHADNSISISLGYGRPSVGSIGRGSGFNVYPLRTTAAPYFLSGAKVTKSK